ncbi:MAG: hypothetical protein EOO68_10470, partial [Moraxellaceae bacterium]
MKIYNSTLFTFIMAVFLSASCKDKDTPKPDPKPDPKPPVKTLFIKTFNPKSGPVGTTVMITGTAFGTDSNAVTIKFGASGNVKPKAITDTAITVIVPADADTAKITVKIDSKTVTSSDIFTPTKSAVPTLSISEISPLTAEIGEVVTIKGKEFGFDNNFIDVTFAGAKPLHPFELAPGVMLVHVPEDAKTGKIQVSVNGGAPVSSKDAFTVKPPTVSISDFNPKSAGIGDTVIITGKGFGTDRNSINVLFEGGAAAKVIQLAAAQLAIIVPEGAKSGKLQVRLQSGGVATSAANFTFQSINITSFSPHSVTEGDTLIINGNFGSNLSNIKVNLNSAINEYVKPFKITAKQMALVVPYHAKTGIIRVIDQTQGGAYADSKDALTIISKIAVYSAIPSSARPGQTTRVNVSILSGDPASISVKFEGASAIHPLSSEGNFIIVRVPANAKTGYFTVSQSGYATGKSRDIFTVLPPMPDVKQGVWTKRSDIGMGNGRFGAVAFTINN